MLSPQQEALKAAKLTYAYIFYCSDNNNSAKLSETEHLLISNVINSPGPSSHWKIKQISLRSANYACKI